MLGQCLGEQRAVRQLEAPLPPLQKTGHYKFQLCPRAQTDHVSLLVVLIFDNEDHVKSGQDGGHKINVLLALGLIPAPEDRVGSCQHRAAGIECSCDSCLQGEGETDRESRSGPSDCRVRRLLTPSERAKANSKDSSLIHFG